MLFDIGVNLTNQQFDPDRHDVIKRAVAEGVAHMVVTGTNLEVSQEAIELAGQWPEHLCSTAGVHPHDASRFSEETIPRLRVLAQSSAVVALGECGLDYNRDFSPRETQRSCFSAQLELAAELKKPVFMHQRDAHADFLACLRPWRAQLSRGVVHCFTGSRDELRDYLDQDLYIGVTGWICDERRGMELRELVREIPLNRLLIETDAPYLLPRDLKPKPKSRRNEPFHLPHIASVIAECMGIERAQVIRHSTDNAQYFFGFPPTTDLTFE